MTREFALPAKQTKPFSARFSVDALELLSTYSEELGQSMSRVAERIISEGVQMERFPGIVFRPGPTGRRAALALGPDVWEIVRDLKSAARHGAPDPVATIAEATGIERASIELAARYYAAHPTDVDLSISRNEEAIEQLRRRLGISIDA
jgi:hypothetical protein